VINLYLKDIDPANIELNRSVLASFYKTFQLIYDRMHEEGCQSKGFVVMPIHRCFTYYLTRLLMFNLVKGENNKKDSQSV
jgi:hypothetical protein